MLKWFKEHRIILKNTLETSRNRKIVPNLYRESVAKNAIYYLYIENSEIENVTFGIFAYTTI